MSTYPLCLKCKSPLDVEEADTYKEYTTYCQQCGSSNAIIVFPAMEHRFVKSQVTVAAELESSCFYHGDRKAERTCDACGRFICNHCTASLDEETLCLPCLMQIREKGSNAKLKNSTTRWDSIALAIVLFSSLLFYLSIITAPIVLYIVIRYWKQGPFSPVQSHRWRMILAGVLAILQLVGWIAMLILFVEASGMSIPSQN